MVKSTATTEKGIITTIINYLLSLLLHIGQKDTEVTHGLDLVLKSNKRNIKKIKITNP